MMWIFANRWFAGGLMLVALVGLYVSWRGHERDIGRQEVLAQNTARAEQASEASRQREKALTLANQGIDRALQDAQARRAAADRVTAVRLRDFQAALDARSTPTTPGSAHGAGGLERELLGECAKALTSLGQEAERLEGKVVGLQAYTRDVCLSAL